MKRLLILILAALGFVQLPAQFVFGWSGGWAPCRELNRELYVYNQINKHGLDKEMGAVHWYQGPVIGFRSGNDDGGFVELLYSRKRCKVGSEFDSAGVAMTREIKTLCNTYNLGFGFQAGDWRVGFSFDGGRYKGFGRRSAKDAIGDTEWDRIWVQDKKRLYGISIYRLYIAETVFVERIFADGLINVRAYCQLPGTKAQFDGLDWFLFKQELNFGNYQEESFWNFGASVTFAIGG